jgi:hypothetical protein
MITIDIKIMLDMFKNIRNETLHHQLLFQQHFF